MIGEPERSREIPRLLTKESYIVHIMCGGACFWPHCKCADGQDFYRAAHKLTAAEGFIDQAWRPKP